MASSVWADTEPRIVEARELEWLRAIGAITEHRFQAGSMGSDDFVDGLECAIRILTREIGEPLDPEGEDHWVELGRRSAADERLRGWKPAND